MTIFFPKTSPIKLQALVSVRRKANCASASVEVILGYQSEITSKHCPKFYSSLWQLWLWLPCSWPTVRVAPSLAAVSSCSSLFLLLSVFVSTSCLSVSFSLYAFCLSFFFFFFHLLFSLTYVHSLQMSNWSVLPPLPPVCVPHRSLRDCLMISPAEKTLRGTVVHEFWSVKF